MSYIPIRWLIALTLCFTGVVTYLTRININNAIVDMVIQTNTSATHPNLCPARHRRHTNVTVVKIEYKDDGDRFDWSPETQGLLLGSFFWTYFLFHTPHGYIAGRYGGRVPICIALLVSGVISLVSPVVAHLPSVTYLILLRSFMGVFQAGIFPGLFVTACNWVPVHERSTILAVNEAGPSIGLILMQFLSGYLIKAYSWTILFYAPGAASLVAFVFVLLFLRNRPEEHPLVSQQELQYIRRPPVADESTALIGDDDDDDDDEGAVVGHQSRDPIPWCGMLTNKSVAAFLFFKFARALAFYLLTAEMPTYFHAVLQEDLVAIGIITSSATGITLISLLVTARAADFLIERRYLSRTKTRKLFCLFAGFANAIFVMLIPALRCNRLAVIAVFFVGAVFYGCQTGSDTPLPAEMTTKYYAVLYAIGIVFANIPGFLSPMLTGYVLGSIDDQWLAWSILFYSTGALLIFASILFMVFVSAKRQDFDFSPTERRGRLSHARC